MKRRDFICGFSCLLAGAAISEIRNKAANKKTSYPKLSDYPELEEGLGSINIAAASHCNLSCKNCDTFSPLSSSEFVEYEQLKKDLKKVKELAPDRDIHIGFIGGEPTLNPDLTKMMKFVNELYPNSGKSILTNGLLLDRMSEEFWKEAKKGNYSFGITKYPLNIPREKYEKIAKENGININYDYPQAPKLYDLNTHEVIDKNYNQEGFVWSKNILDLTGSQDYIEKRYTCPHKGIITYTRGNLYYCYVHAHIKSFIDYFKVNIPVTKDDYIKIAEVKDIQEIDKFISTPKPLCRFCKQCHNTCYGGKPLEWGFSKREITEWTMG